MESKNQNQDNPGFNIRIGFDLDLEKVSPNSTQKLFMNLTFCFLDYFFGFLSDFYPNPSPIFS